MFGLLVRNTDSISSTVYHHQNLVVNPNSQWVLAPGSALCTTCVNPASWNLNSSLRLVKSYFLPLCFHGNVDELVGWETCVCGGGYLCRPSSLTWAFYQFIKLLRSELRRFNKSLAFCEMKKKEAKWVRESAGKIGSVRGNAHIGWHKGKAAFKAFSFNFIQEWHNWF